jgi:non-specific serine/threonine protein kinase
LGSSRLVTLTGPGGCGKTRLALEVATALAAEFPDGAWFIELAPLSDGGLAASFTTAALGVREQSGRPVLETLTDALRPRTLLLVLDNCEHIVAECAGLAEALLRACPGLKVLATSREALGAEGEVIWNVPPLALPPPGQVELALVSRFEAVELFVEKAAAAETGFALTPENVELVVQICRELDGLPLAIELAAARCKTLSLQEIATRLGERFSLLTMGQRTAPARHQTLQATIDWSYLLLDANERAVFQRLAVFSGGWTLDAAGAVCSDVPHLLDILANLVTKSLVLKFERGGVGRYSFLETIRQYAWEKLERSDQLSAVRTRHLDYYLSLAEQAAPWLRRTEELAWLERLQADHDNLRAALTWTAHLGGVMGLRLVAALQEFWTQVGNVTEAGEWVERVLAASPDAPAGARANGLVIAGELACERGDPARAVALLEAGLRLYKELADTAGIARALSELGVVEQYQGNRRQAVTLLEESVALARQVGDRFMVGDCLLWLAGTQMNLGELDAAQDHYEETLVLFRELGERLRTAWSYFGLGDIARRRGDYARAAELFKQGLEVKFEIGGTGDIYYLLEWLANLAAQTDMPDRAARLWGAAQAIREVVGTPLPPSIVSDYAPYMTSARKELGSLAFEAAWAEGRAMTIEEAIAYALREPEPSREPSSRTSRPPPDTLTARERQVLGLIVVGLTNQEIAEQLVLSLGTVKWYTTSIYAKLGVQSRTQAAARAKELNLS